VDKSLGIDTCGSIPKSVMENKKAHLIL
jgi:hypothetical protein